jgi:hypothetical protein
MKICFFEVINNERRAKGKEIRYQFEVPHPEILPLHVVQGQNDIFGSLINDSSIWRYLPSDVKMTTATREESPCR